MISLKRRAMTNEFYQVIENSKWGVDGRRLFCNDGEKNLRADIRENYPSTGETLKKCLFR